MNTSGVPPTYFVLQQSLYVFKLRYQTSSMAKCYPFLVGYWSLIQNGHFFLLMAGIQQILFVYEN